MIVTQFQFGPAGRVKLADPVAVVIPKCNTEFGSGFSGTEAFSTMDAFQTVVGVDSDIAVLTRVIQVDGGIPASKIAGAPFSGGCGERICGDGQDDQEQCDESSCSF